MPLSNNPLKDYSAIAENTKIAFKSGTQAALNIMIQQGGAEEGTFYLTTDTHKLYVGRKKTSDNKVYPEQVSRGVTVVGTAEELPNPAPSGAIEEGELFYITNKNILAALKYIPADSSATPPVSAHYEWVQINPPTGIDEVLTSASQATNDPNVDIRTTIATAAGNQIGAFKIAAGDNVTLTAGSDSVDLGISGTKANQGKITISATDTTYKAGVESNDLNHNDATIGLKSNSNTALDTDKIHIQGANSVAVSSNATTNTVTVSGINLTGVTVDNITTSIGGFTIGLAGTSGNGDALNVSGSFSPAIKYGATSGYSEPASTVAFNQNTEVKFVNGIATLNTYTKEQADQAITDAVNAKLATANAMTYKGTVTSANAAGDTTSLWQQVSHNGAHNGDVYKVSAVNSDSPITINDQVAKVGDLIIISGTETNGEVPIPNNNAAGLLTVCDLIPSGDEPEFVATPITSATRDNASGFQIADGKVVNSNLLTTRFISGNKIDVTSALDSNDATGKTENITIAHSATSRTDSVAEALQNNGTANAVLTKAVANATDSIGMDTWELFAFSDPTKALVTDEYGHVTGFKGKKINFQHNYVDSIDVSYNASNGNIGLTANNNIAGFNSASPSLLKFTSETLQIKGNVDQSHPENNALKIDFVWGTF